jgi:general secretion pathway protein K
MRAEIDQAQASAAADAGLAIALNGLLSNDPASRWSIDGRQRKVSFRATELVIRIEDERGKVPISLIEEGQLTKLLEGIGLGGDRLRVARDSLLDWVDDDDEPRPDGAERGYYRPSGFAPRNGSLLSIDELSRIRGFDAALVERLRPVVTVNYGSGPFDARYAHPLALAIMLDVGVDSPLAIQRRRELDGQVTAIALESQADIIGKPLSIIVNAKTPSGARAKRNEIVELTGLAARPYVVRSYE